MKKERSLPWEALLFFALYIILPEYFALELGQKLPLLTASRILLVTMFVGLVVRRKELFFGKGFSLKKLNLLLTENKLLRWGLCVYFALLVLVNATFLLETTEAIKQLFVTASEEFLLVWMLSLILDSRARINGALKLMALASGAMGIVAILGCILDVHPFYYLKTVTRSMPMYNSYRLGLLRAQTGFAHPVYYGAYCAVMLPLCMYLQEYVATNRKQRLLYAGCIVLTLVGLVLSNSRGSLLAFGVLAVALFVLYWCKKQLWPLFKNYLPSIILAGLVLLLVTGLTVGTAYLNGVGQSLVNVVPKPTSPISATEPVTDPTDSTLTPDATDPTDATEPDTGLDYGENVNGLGSRLDQLTGIRYTLERRPLFGFGANAHARGLIGYMYYPGRWSFVKTVDMNIVAIISQYGLVGMVAFLSLFGSLGITLVKKKYWAQPLTRYLGLAFICYMLCLLSISALDKWFWVLAGLILAAVNCMDREERECAR